MIEFDRVNVHYGKNHVLHDLTAKIEAGEVVALIGANAAGKTTALRTALGLKNLSSGSLRFAGEDVSSLSTHERVERGLILVPEGRQVFVKFTVTENLLMGAYHRNDRNKVQVELDHVYDLFPRLRERKSQKAGSMSGGEQQMLAIGRGLGKTEMPVARRTDNGAGTNHRARDFDHLRQAGRQRHNDPPG